MNILKMNRFGKILTDREYAQRMAKKVLAEETFPLVLDFEGVISLGSSFGDEVVHAVAQKQGLQIEVKNASTAVRHCLALVADDFKIKIKYL